MKVDEVRKRPVLTLLDLCCGTGDMGITLNRMARTPLQLTSLDFCGPMLEQAKKRWEDTAPRRLTQEFLRADAQATGLPAGHYDAITLLFSLRNMPSLPALFLETKRLLKPGGIFYALELSRPPSAWLRGPFYLYLNHLLPLMGGLLSGQAVAYRYLAASIMRFPAPPEVVSLLRQAGLAKAEATSWSGGLVTLYQAES